MLKALFEEPDRLDPRQRRDSLTQAAARHTAELLDALVERGVDAHEAAHFLMKLVFCFFAQDTRLLPSDILTRLLNVRPAQPERLARQLTTLFATMAVGGEYGTDIIAWFNGGLFDDQPALVLEPGVIALLREATKLDWSLVEPSHFGNLFEGALSRDTAKRRRLGAHYTSRADIELIVEPVLMAPLRAEWAAVEAECAAVAGDRAAQPASAKGRALIAERVAAFRARLSSVRVLDPACGSGNFLYVALAALLDLDYEVFRAASAWGVAATFALDISPAQMLGLDLEPYAVELARLTVSIGYLQWQRNHLGSNLPEPLLPNLGGIRCADAILGEDGTEPEWPECYAIVGNPPFLGDKMMRAGLGAEYVGRVRALYSGRVPGGADLCCYWFERARTEMAAGRAVRAGLLATNSIRQTLNRVVIERITKTGGVFWHGRTASGCWTALQCGFPSLDSTAARRPSACSTACRPAGSTPI